MYSIHINNLFSRVNRPKGNQFKLLEGRCQLGIIGGGLGGKVEGIHSLLFLISFVLKLFPHAGPATEDANGL